MQGYITIKEASALTGKHADTIRRLWQDKEGKVIPEIQSKYTQKDRKGRLLIDKQWLLNSFELLSDPTSTDNVEVEEEPIIKSKVDSDPTIMAMQAHIDSLSAQLGDKQKTIDNLQKNLDNAQQVQAMLTKQLPAQTTPSDIPQESTQETAHAEVMQTEVKVHKQATPKKKTTPSKPQVKKIKKVTTKQVKSKPVVKVVEEEKVPWWRRKL